eukprot:355076-Amphidinium_carterae.1
MPKELGASPTSTPSSGYHACSSQPQWIHQQTKRGEPCIEGLPSRKVQHDAREVQERIHQQEQALSHDDTPLAVIVGCHLSTRCEELSRVKLRMETAGKTCETVLCQGLQTSTLLHSPVHDVIRSHASEVTLHFPPAKQLQTKHIALRSASGRFQE